MAVVERRAGLTESVFIPEVCACSVVLRPIHQPGRDLGVRFLLPAIAHPASPGTASHHSACCWRDASEKRA
jgi:hypothetical protein